MDGSPTEDPGRYDLPGLIPWLTRTEALSTSGQLPMDALKTPALCETYVAATKSLQRGDAVILTIVSAFEALYRATAQPTPSVPTTTEEFYRIGLLAWAGSTIAPPTRSIFFAGIEGVLQAYLVQAHSAFETFVGDVWEAAVNVHPAILADMTGKARTRKGDNAERGADEDPKSEKSISLELLRIHSYDVSKSMGTLIRRAGHARFGTLSGIRQAYERAFRKDSDSIIEALNDPSLDVIAAVRNNIIHRGGIIDANYLAAVKGKAWAPLGDVDKPLHLDGGTIAKLLLGAYPKAIGLILAVDDWLTSHLTNGAGKV